MPTTADELIGPGLRELPEEIGPEDPIRVGLE